MFQILRRLFLYSQTLWLHDQCIKHRLFAQVLVIWVYNYPIYPSTTFWPKFGKVNLEQFVLLIAWEVCSILNFIWWMMLAGQRTNFMTMITDFEVKYLVFLKYFSFVSFLRLQLQKWIFLIFFLVWVVYGTKFQKTLMNIQLSDFMFSLQLIIIINVSNSTSSIKEKMQYC